MKIIKDKIINFIVDKRYYILVLFTILSLFSLFLSTKVNINYDISKYLPTNSETKIGKNIMDKNFSGTNTSTLNLMFEGLENDKKNIIQEELSRIDGVSKVLYDETDNYNKDDYTLYIITLADKEDSELASNLYNEIIDNYSNYEIYTSGSISEWNKPVLHLWIIVFAIVSAIIILIIMCESYIEPFLFLYAIGLAVFVNMGTNIIFSSVSNITNSIAAILQLALSMDYSIMLMNRYSQEREKEKDKQVAMKKALFYATSQITSSSVTTIVGLLALVFMSFTIGADLGFVLAKGVLLSLISIFLVLPALILLFDKSILKTKKKSLNFKMNFIGNFVYSFRYPALIIFIILFGVSFVLKDGVNILYTGSENDKIASVFSENNQIAIIYNSSLEKEVTDVFDNLDDDKISEILSYSTTIGEKLKYNEVNEKINSLGLDVTVDEYILKLVYYNYYNKDNQNKMTINEFVEFVNKDILNNKDLSKNIDQSTKTNLSKLTNFTDQKKINKKRTAKDIANILEVDEDLVKDIFILYNSLSVDNKMQMGEFLNFINQNIIPNKKYSNMIKNEDRENIQKIVPFTDKKIINKEVNDEFLSNMFFMSKSDVKGVMSLYYTKYESDMELSLIEFLEGIKFISSNSDYLDDVDLEKILVLEEFIYNKNDFNNTKLNKQQLEIVFSNINNNLVNLVYSYFNFNDDYKFSPSEFIEFVILNFESVLDNNSLNNLKLIKLIMESTNNKTSYKASELAKLFNLKDENIFILYTLIGLNNNYEFKLSPNQFVNIILSDENLLNKLDISKINLLKLVKEIMNYTNLGKKFSAKEISNILGIEENKVKLIYSFADSKSILMSLDEFTDFIINDVVKRPEYKKYFNSDTKKQLESIRKVINSSLKKEKLTAGKTYMMLSTLNKSLNDNLVDMVYLYNGSIKEFKDDYELSLEELITYLNNDILLDSSFNEFLDKDKKDIIINANEKINDAKKILTNNGYSRIILNTKYYFEGEETFNFIANLKNSLKFDDIYIIGDSPMAYEISKSFNEELNLITILTMIAIFIVVAITFKSFIIPLILVFIIQCAVYITMSILSLTGTNCYFISLLIVQSILMGATIDYAIVYTTYYIEMRKSFDIKKSLIEAYNKSIHTILCSSSILVIVTLIVGNFASQIAAKICMTLSKGSLCAALLIIFILPPILAIFDKIIIKKDSKKATIH